MNESVSRTNRATIAVAIGLLILSIISGLALGQGGTGRTNRNSAKPAPRRTTPVRRPTRPRGTRPRPTPAPTPTPESTEPEFWETIRNSSDVQDFREYLEAYPNGPHAALARTRIRQLEAAKAKPAGVPGVTSTPTPTATPTPKPAATPTPVPTATPVPPDSSPANTTPTKSGPSNLPRTRTNQIKMEFVLIPPGSFMMGSTSGEPNEKPVHQVTINYSFYMGTFEVTQAEWQSLMGNNPSRNNDCPRCPVEQVSWNDTQEFIRKLNQMNDGYTYRLPTEAEWEYAGRAGTTRDYAGNLKEMGWYSENSGNRTRAVGLKQPNAWGLFDMHGNVWEWCEDWYHDTYFGAPTDGSAWLGGEPGYRVLRGGSWYLKATYLRSAVRNRNSLAYRDRSFGFRVVAVARTQANSSSTTPTTVDEDPFLVPPDTRNLPGDTKSQASADPPAEKVYTVREVDQRAQVLEKPPPVYTEEARKNSVIGTIVLRAVLSSTGQVTNITVVRGLPHGLTERTIEAAKKMKFKPAMKDGKPVSQTVQLEYNLNLY